MPIVARIHTKHLDILEFDFLARLPTNVIGFHLMFMNVIETYFHHKQMCYVLAYIIMPNTI